MSKNSKYSSWRSIGVTLSILYIITVLVYWGIYEPLEYIDDNGTIPEITRVNEIIKSINQDSKSFFLIAGFFVCLFISIIIVRIYEEIQLYNQPIEKVSATLKSKEIYTRIGGGFRVGRYMQDSYKLEFKSDDQIKFIFFVSFEQYFPILEGNKGILTYKEGRRNKYIGFEIKQIK
ncbi:MAG: DUF2500 domain-containing protein [Anaeromicrobium sp.]|nr:DUF2500 domain-containing protein [Anaeromicrobium sp.]